MCKIKAAFAIILLAVTALVFGCSRVNVNEPEQEEFPVPVIKNITIWTFGVNVPSIDDIIEQFKSDNPEFSLDILVYDWTLDPIVTIASAVIANTMPDLVGSGPARLFYYTQTGQSMEPYIKLDPSFDRSDFHDIVYRFNLIGDEMWGLTCSIIPNVMIYNKDIFEAAGLDSDKPPET